MLARMSERASQVTNEELMAAAFFGRQLQADVNYIKKQTVGEAKIPDVDIRKIMPQAIIASRQPQPTPAPPVFVPSPPAFVPPPVQQNNTPIAEAINSTVLVKDDSQLEFNFNKVTRYEDILEAIEKIERKINMINEKLDQLTLDKKKPKQTQLKNGTQAS